MSPQFVDFNADGVLDIVAGNFSGSPHISYGSKEGYSKPEQILDGTGQRILLNMFWNYESEKWDETKRCDAAGTEVPTGQGTSTVALDADGDGDFDLLLGDYRSGRIYQRINEGSNASPKFASVNVALRQGAQALAIPGKIETMRLVDWDKDGLVDLLCGSVGSDGPDMGPAGVYWVRNIGKAKELEWAAPKALVSAASGASSPTPLPMGGFYPEAGDMDGDGDYDLIVGAKCQWKEQGRELSQADRARLAELELELEDINKKINAFYQKLTEESANEDADTSRELFQKLMEERAAEFNPLVERQSTLATEKDALAPGPKQGYFVFYYENLGS